MPKPKLNFMVSITLFGKKLCDKKISKLVTKNKIEKDHQILSQAPHRLPWSKSQQAT